MKKNAILIMLVCTLVITKDAFAYLDPGTGSYVLQVVLGMLAAGFFAIKHYWQRIKQLLAKKPVDEDKTDN